MFNALINSLSKIGAELDVVSSFYTLPLTTSLAGSDASASCVVKSLAVTWHCHRPSSNSRVADLTHKEQSPMSGLPTHSYFFKCIPIGWNDSSRGQLAVVITGIRLSNGNIMSGGWNIGGNSTTFRKSFVNGGGDHYRRRGEVWESETRAKRKSRTERGDTNRFHRQWQPGCMSAFRRDRLIDERRDFDRSSLPESSQAPPQLSPLSLSLPPSQPLRFSISASKRVPSEMNHRLPASRLLLFFRVRLIRWRVGKCGLSKFRSHNVPVIQGSIPYPELSL